ncbi:hypothetical protein RHMOL_Rhmol11G0272600 [Rhododendron molle]|uniref:Uncharacterized protein n=1 Tax=Rhododendron molle TaxID=49168 RepID=A0ACC0LWS4_RHOML|nr:hypothetical protein RHMOL_Rhmol11G0272600 [Rhododendron molle]
MCDAFTNRKLVRDVAAGSIPASLVAMVELLINKSICYGLVASLTCAYSIALWAALVLLLQKNIPIISVYMFFLAIEREGSDESHVRLVGNQKRLSDHISKHNYYR